jgi:hypothetical protein
MAMRVMPWRRRSDTTAAAPSRSRSVRDDDDRRQPGGGQPAGRGCHGRVHPAVADEEPRSRTDDARTVDGALDTQSRQRAHARRGGDYHLTRPGLVHDGAGNRVLGVLLHGRGDAEEFDCVGPAQRFDHPDRDLATGQRARLVEGHRGDAGQALQRRAALDQHTPARGARECRHHRHRRRNDQGARARHHEDDEGPVYPGRRVATGQDGHHAEQQRHHHDSGRVPGGEAVDELLHRRATRLRLLDEVDDAGQRGVVATARDADDQGAMAVDGPGEHLVAHGLLHRDGLAGDRGLVHIRAPVQHRSVERQPLAGADQHPLSGRHAVEWDHALDLAIGDAGLGRRQVQQRSDGGARTLHAARLEPLRDGEEEHDHRGLFPLAEDEGPRHGNHHQGVDVEGAPAQRGPRALHGEHAAREHRSQEHERRPAGHAPRHLERPTRGHEHGRQ